MMSQAVPILPLFEQRRKALGLSSAAVARRAQVSLRTVQRIMSGDGSNATLSTLTRIADVLGIELAVKSLDLNEVRRRQAEAKARQLVGLIQGTMGLEASALDAASLDDLRDKTVRDLLRGSNRRLWED